MFVSSLYHYGVLSSIKVLLIPQTHFRADKSTASQPNAPLSRRSHNPAIQAAAIRTQCPWHGYYLLALLLRYFNQNYLRRRVSFVRTWVLGACLAPRNVLEAA
jgi:hypothetical protein